MTSEERPDVVVTVKAEEETMLVFLILLVMTNIVTDFPFAAV